jgi:diguanylate cyclase (GGDEF)-like protein
MRRIDWSSRGRARVVFWTIFGSACCMAIALAVDYTNFAQLRGERLTRALLQNTLLPLILAAPAIYLLTNKIRQLAIAQYELSVVAATDSLTSVLNRGAFTMLVDAYLSQTRMRDNEIRGALLVVDADHFKTVNDRFGHDQGDVALKIIAHSIRDVLRGADIVGRLGGEEFGVFLPGSDGDQATSIAERIRGTIADADFVPDGARRPLSVSVGGAVFERRIEWTELYRIADRQLYAAKDAGRNRVVMGYVPQYAAAAA